MMTWRSYSALTLVLGAAATAVWLALPPSAVSRPVVQPQAQAAPVPGMAEQFYNEKRDAKEEPLPPQF